MEKWLMIIAICDGVIVIIALFNLIATTYFTHKNEKRNDRLLEQNDKTNNFLSSYKETLASIQWGYSDCIDRLKKLEKRLEPPETNKENDLC